MGLVEITEKADADRLKHLLELAQLRCTILDALMDQLGIPNIHDSQDRLVLGVQFV